MTNTKIPDSVPGVFRVLEAADIINLNQEQVDELIAKYLRELKTVDKTDEHNE